MLKLMLLITVSSLSACSYIEGIEGSDKEKNKVNVLLSDKCKVSTKRRALRMKCRWRF